MSLKRIMMSVSGANTVFSAGNFTGCAKLSGVRRPALRFARITCAECKYAYLLAISFIIDKTVIQKIHTHLGVFEQNSKQRAPLTPSQRESKPSEVVAYEDEWPGSGEPLFGW
jgi:hypothetical protein